MKKIALSEKYTFKIASYGNYKELQKIAAVGPGVIVGGPHSGLMLPPSTRPEDNPEEETPEEDAPGEPAISSQEPVSFEEEDTGDSVIEALNRKWRNQTPEELERRLRVEKGWREERERTSAEYWLDEWENKSSLSKSVFLNAMGLDKDTSAEEYAEAKVGLWNEFYKIRPMTQTEFDQLIEHKGHVRKSIAERSGETPEYDAIYMLMHETAGRMSSEYEENNRPPALGKLTRLIAYKEYKKIRLYFNQLWTDLTAWHRDAGLPLPPRVSHNFRTIDTIVRNL